MWTPSSFLIRYMNLLPKKSWHVGKKENKERVFRDELDAKIEEERRQKAHRDRTRQDQLAALRSKQEPDDVCRFELFGPYDMPKYLYDTEKQKYHAESKNERIGSTFEKQKNSILPEKRGAAITAAEAQREAYQASKYTETFKTSIETSALHRTFDPFAMHRYTKDTSDAISNKSLDVVRHPSRFKRSSALDREDPLCIMPKRPRK
jgi:hypothetical protein